MENEDFWAPFSKNDPKMIKKALPREGFRNTISKRRETLLNLSNFEYFKMQKRVAETLIKPMEFWDFGSQKSKNGLRNDQKSIT